MEYLKGILFVLGYFFVLISLIPLIRNDNWIFRVFEYPRAQKLLINIFILIAFVFVFNPSNTHESVFLFLLAVNTVYLFYQIFPYTFFAKKQMRWNSVQNRGDSFKVMIANVYQDNRDIKSCLKSIEENNPDVVLLVETDHFWKEQLDRSLAKHYAYSIAEPLDNTYGMLLFSKFKLIDHEIKYLVENDVPSIHTTLQLPSGKIIKLYGLHPKPPVPHENVRSTERDAEILIVAREARKEKLPVIVAGDLNDVAWSYTTELFLKTSKLLDPRRGRGFYNTFHAHYRFLRWPLDHIFCSPHFELISLKRLPSIGSDHFPILVELTLVEEHKSENKEQTLEASKHEKAFVNEKIQKADRPS